MADQLSSLKTQLAKSKKRALEVESFFTDKIQLLAQFTSKLSLVCKGQDTELDTRLGKLRKALGKGSDLNLLEPLIEEISGLLKNQEAKNEQRYRSLQSSIESAGKALQKRKGLPPQLRRDLREMLAVELTEVKSVPGFIPLLERIIGYYHDVMLSSSQGGEDEQQSCEELSEQLLRLLGELPFDKQDFEQIKTIQVAIRETQTFAALLQLAMKTLELIVNRIHEERHSAQSFLFDINDSLSHLHQKLQASLERSQNLGSKMTELNRRIEDKMAELSRDTHSATSLDELKSLVNEKLDTLALDLKQKDDLETVERAHLLESMQLMNSRVKELERQAADYKAKLEEQTFKSLQDSLTQLPNRAAFDARILDEDKRYARSKKPYCLAVLDVDHFKRINDTYGHAAGDKTLQVIASAVKKSLRDTDFLARFGGEEFVLIMPETTLKQTKSPLDKIRKVIESIPFKFKNVQVTITISIGVSEISSGDTRASLFERADSALYKAKSSGRNKVVAD